MVTVVYFAILEHKLKRIEKELETHNELSYR